MQALKQDNRMMSFVPDERARRQAEDRRYRILSFVIPFLILFLAYALCGAFPVGKRHILTVDLYHQYAPFMALYREKLLSGSSFFYTVSGGLGVNFFALLAYYLASPFNLLLILFPPAFLTEGVLLITLLKIGLAGFAFHFFLKTAYRRRGLLAVAFSTFYALSGFTLAYAWNVMWLDTLFWLPVVMAALIRLMRDGRWLLFPVALALMIASHYYTAYMAALFILLMFPVLFLRSTEGQPAKRKWVVFFSVVGLTALAVALTMVLIYPTWKSLQLTSASGDAFPKPELAGAPLTYLGQLFPFLEPTVRSGGPNIYAGSVVLFLLPIYVVSGRIRLRDKILHLIVLFLLFLSFDFNVFNFIWHGLHYPNQLPDRFSFVVVFLILSMAYEAMRSVGDYSRMEIGLLGFLVMFAVPVVTKLVDDIKAPSWLPWATLLFLIMYLMAFLLLRTRKVRRRSVALALFVIMSLEVVFSTVSGILWIDRNEYFGLRDGYAAGTVPNSIRSAAEKIDEMESGALSFYRTEVKPHKTSNDPALYGLRGLSLFASTSPESAVAFFKNMGYQNNGINSYQYRGSTLFADSLFSIRYVIEREKSEIVDERPVVLGNSSVTVYQNPYAFPLAFVADSKITSFSSRYGNPFKTQNDLADAISGKNETMFRLLKPTIEQGTGELSFFSEDKTLFHFSRVTGGTSTYQLSWTAERSGPHYLNVDLRGHSVQKIDADVNGHRVSIDASKKGITELGSVEKGAPIRLTVVLSDDAKTSGEFALQCASLDTRVLAVMAENAGNNGLALSSFNEDRFFGVIRAEKPGYILMSIPYDPGWHAEINGEPAAIEVIDGALMALPVKEGEHTLSMRFVPVGFYEGLYVTLGALAILIALVAVFFARRRRQEKEQAASRDAERTEREEQDDSFFRELLAARAEREKGGVAVAAEEDDSDDGQGTQTD